MRLVKIIVGATAVGKTDYSIGEALKYDSPILSCDSRQVFKEMSIGTAVPSEEQLSLVKHYFIHSHSLDSLFSAGQYEIEALSLVNQLFEQGHEVLLMSGGSGFYVEAFYRGLNIMPEADLELRRTLYKRLDEEGIEVLQSELKDLDPIAYNSIEIANKQRLIRALEVCKTSSRPFSSYKIEAQKRDFDIELICLNRPREELYSRINLRVDKMLKDGLLEEVEALLPYRDYNALQTVGYKEIFDYLDGKISLNRAVELIKQHTRNYAKRQLSWWRRYSNMKWLDI